MLNLKKYQVNQVSPVSQLPKINNLYSEQYARLRARETMLTIANTAPTFLTP